MEISLSSSQIPSPKANNYDTVTATLAPNDIGADVHH
jgi:hypothetical protein